MRSYSSVSIFPATKTLPQAMTARSSRHWPSTTICDGEPPRERARPRLTISRSASAEGSGTTMASAPAAFFRARRLIFRAQKRGRLHDNSLAIHLTRKNLAHAVERPDRLRARDKRAPTFKSRLGSALPGEKATAQATQGPASRIAARTGDRRMRRKNPIECRRRPVRQAA